MLLELAIAFIIGVLTYWLHCFYYYYKYLHHIPSPKVWPILGSMLEFKNTDDSLENFARNMKALKTNVLRVHIGFRAILIIQDYKFIQFLLNSTTIVNKGISYNFFKPWLGEGLLTSAGERWRNHRKMITPTFHFKILEQFVDVFNTNGVILLEKLRKQVGQPSVDIYPFITLCALDVICETAMGTSVNAQQEETSLYAQCVKDMGRIVQVRGFNPLYHREYIYKLTNLYKEEQAALKVLHGYTNSVIYTRRQKLMEQESSTQEPNDMDDLGRKKKEPFLDMLLKATVDGKPLTDEEIREEVSTFMFGGHDTTAAAVSYALYNLANHPIAQEKAFEELRSIFGDDKQRFCTYLDLTEMKYMDLVIKETLRLYPSAPSFTRRSLQDFVYDGKVYPKDITLVILAYGIHHDSEHFPDPEKFEPDRFSSENTERKPFAYIPFSAGPRNCIGQKFAFMEMKAIISMVLRNFELKPATPKHTIKLASHTVLKAINGVKIAFEERKYLP